jgi:5,10-methenyltetrahydrofolate synthetase
VPGQSRSSPRSRASRTCSLFSRWPGPEIYGSRFPVSTRREAFAFTSSTAPLCCGPAHTESSSPPPELEELEPPQIDLALLPGVAFDLVGGRLGRGRAYYDRAFPIGAPAPVLVGVGFAFQLVDRVPLGEYDRLLDGVVTEQGLRWCTASDCES